MNLASHQAQCLLPLDFPEVASASWDLLDLLSEVRYVGLGEELVSHGLFVDLPAFGYHLLRLQPRPKELPRGVEPRCTFQEHRGPIYSLAWSQDSELIASAGVEGTIWLWRAGNNVTPVRRLEGHTKTVNCLAWSPVKREVVSGSHDRTVRLWDAETGAHRIIAEHHTAALCIAWSPDGQLVASGSQGGSVHLDARTSEDIYVFHGHQDAVNAVAWQPKGRILASGSGDGTIMFWDVDARSRWIEPFQAESWISCAAWSPDGRCFAAGTGGGTISLWDVTTGKRIVVLEGHTVRILAIAFSPDGRLLVSKSADNTVRFWNPHTWKELAAFDQRGEYLSGLAFHPELPILATRDDWANAVRVFDLDLDALLGADSAARTVIYTNAKIVLLGDSSAGKTCLTRALMRKPFEPQPSTHGMAVSTYLIEPVRRADGSENIREAFLWDLAGQAFCRIIHQLFLDQSALGLIVFDAARSDNPLSSAVYWTKTFRRLAGSDRPLLLVAGRADSSPVGISVEAIERFRIEHDFREFIATSALTGDGIDRLREAIAQQIPWDSLPATSSPELWKKMREYLLERRDGDNLLTRGADLREAYRARYPGDRFADTDFEQVVTLAEVQGLVLRLSFGGFVLLRPEILDGYASAIVRQALKHPQNLGSVSERDVLEARIDFAGVKRIGDARTERSLLHSVVELLLDRQVVLREGEYLVIPSTSLRPPPLESEPSLLRVATLSFDGPADEIYATLVVRLFYGDAFDLTKHWQNTAEFSDALGRRCRIQLTKSAEGHGDLAVLFEESISLDSKVLILRFIHRHLLRHALAESVVYECVYTCTKCRKEIPGEVVQYHRGKTNMLCPFCYARISLIAELEVLGGDRTVQRGIEAVETLERVIETKTGDEVGIMVTKGKEQIREFDVFLAHNHRDKPQVKAIAEELKRRGLNPWLDKEQIPPGRWFQDIIQAAIQQVKTAAICIGPHGVGEWEQMELRPFVERSVGEGLPVIPVLLPGVTEIPPNLPFLCGRHEVRFNERIDELEALDDLVWGITGVRPVTPTMDRAPGGKWLRRKYGTPSPQRSIR